MAQQITFWQMEGKSDVEIKTVRLKSKADIAQVMASMPVNCDIATLNRTDKQSNITHEIWTSKKYISLDDR